MNSEAPATLDPTLEARLIPGWQAVSRQRAFLTHLLCSALVVGTVCLIVFLVWYPGPYVAITNTWRPLRVLVGVDLVLGPLLTLLLFKPGKKGLLFDLITILLIQLAALAYGVSVIYSNRPYFDVFAIDRFVVLARADVPADEWAAHDDRIGSKPLFGPVRAYASLPTDARTRDKVVMGSLLGGRDIEQRPEMWSPYKDHLDQVIASVRPLSDLKTANPKTQQRLEKLSAQLGLPADQLGFLPVMNGTRAATLILDRKTAEVLTVLNKDPWTNE